MERNTAGQASATLRYSSFAKSMVREMGGGTERRSLQRPQTGHWSIIANGSPRNRSRGTLMHLLHRVHWNQNTPDDW